MPLSILIRLISMLLAATSVVAMEASLYAAPDSIMLPTGFVITPTSVPDARLELLNPHLKCYPDFIASGAVATALSPDKRTLLILTSGYNRNYNASGASIPEDSQQYVFVYDITHNRPERKQVLRIPNSFAGVSFDPGGQKF